MRTERTLQQAALTLFAKQGYDETTTEEIAERAGVSPRTFFRYFATKESVLFVGEYGWFQSFTTEFLNQPESLSDLDAIRTTLISLSPGWDKIRKSLLLYERAVASSPTLRGQVRDRQQDDIKAVAEAVATRRGLGKPDESCSLLGAISLLIFRRALTSWLDGRANVDPSALVAAEFDLLGELLAPTNGKRSSSARAR
jgi:AcrR family transcriptional regulator